MSWDLVSTTDTGYKKYRDNHGNLRYQKPNGQFTNRNAWAGTHSQGATEQPKGQSERGSVPVPQEGPDISVNTGVEAGGYEEEKTYTIQEPDNGYATAMDNPLPSRGYLIRHYPVHDRIEDLTEITEEELPDYDVFAWGIHTIRVDDGGVLMSTGYRYTEHMSEMALADAAFKAVIDEIEHNQNTSPGENILVTETRGVFFKYE